MFGLKKKVEPVIQEAKQGINRLVALMASVLAVCLVTLAVVILGG